MDNKCIGSCHNGPKHCQAQDLDSNFPWFDISFVDVVYQTQEIVFHRDIQIPRRELKIRHAAEYFWWNLECLDSPWNAV